MTDPVPGNGVYTAQATLPNDIPTVSLYIKNILDEIYEAEAKTSGMTPDPALVQAAGQAGVFKLATIEATGLGDYSVQSGYPTGAGKVSWESYELACDRGIRYTADDKETILGGGLPTAVAFFSTAMRTKFVPEIDAYRFAKTYDTIYNNTAIRSTNIDTPSPALSGSDVISAVIDGLDVVSNATGIDDGMTIYMSSALRSLIHKSSEYTKFKDIGGGSAFDTDISTINGNNIVWVPKERMLTKIDLLDGYTNAYSDTSTTPKTVDWTKFGYKKGSGAKYINFVIAPPNTCMGITAINAPKIIPKEQSEIFDADQAMLRLWHDLIIPKNKQPGVYISVGGSA